MTFIREAHLEQTVKSIRLMAMLRRVHAALGEHGIDCLVLKGPAVGLRVFERLSLREFTDLDLLLRPADIGKARVVLKGLGFVEAGDGDDGELHSLGTKHVQYMLEAEDILVELHWAVSPRSLAFPLDFDVLWKKSEELEFQGFSFRTPCLEDTLLSLCIHGSWHGWYCLKWVYDIAAIVHQRSGQVDWSRLLADCEGMGAKRMLMAGLRLAYDLFDTKPPVAVWEAGMETTSLVQLSASIRDTLLAGKQLQVRDKVKLQIALHDRLPDRFYTAVSITVTDLPRLLPKSAVPITSGPLRFLTRPVRLINRYGVGWFRSAMLGR